jgi:hypothetical protein
MQFKVHMLTFGNPEEFRIVDVPPKELLNKTEKEVLELIFQYGQNDFQPQDHPSVSVGDVIEYYNKYFAVSGVGFAEISEQEFEKNKNMTREERFVNSLNKKEMV